MAAFGGGEEQTLQIGAVSSAFETLTGSHVLATDQLTLSAPREFSMNRRESRDHCRSANIGAASVGICLPGLAAS